MAQTSDLTPAQRWRKDIVKKLLGGLSLTLVLNVALNLAMVVIAAMKLEKCPAEPLIPRILLAAGVVGIVVKLIGLLRDILLKYFKVNSILVLLSTAWLVLFIMGSYYTYRRYKPKFDPSSGKEYCDKTVYMFSLVYVSVIYAMLALMIVTVGCFVFGIMIYDKCCYKREESPSQMATKV